MTPTQFTTLTPGQHVRITGYTKQGIVLRKSRYVSSALIRWPGGTIAWEEYYRLELV